MKETFTKPTISIRILIAICVFCVSSSVAITKYVVSSLNEMEIRKLNREIDTIKESATNINDIAGEILVDQKEKNAFYVGYYFRGTTFHYILMATANEITKQKGMDIDFSDMPQVLEPFKQELAARIKSLKIDISIPTKFEEKYLVDTDTTKRYINSLHKKIQLQIRVNHGNRAVDVYRFGSSLGHLQSIISAGNKKSSLGLFSLSTIDLTIKKETALALSLAESLGINKDLLKGLRDFEKNGGDTDEFSKAIEPLQKYYW